MLMESILNFLSLFFWHWLRSKRSFYALLSLLLLCLLAYNAATIFCTHVPVPAKKPASFLPENATGKSRTFHALPSSTRLLSVATKETSLPGNSTTLLVKDQNLVVPTKRNRAHPEARRGRRHRRAMKVLDDETEDVRRFGKRVVKFFGTNSSCRYRFFMTWISSVESFGAREKLCLESVFKAHADGCLIIVSNTMDSRKGMKALRPFSNRGFKVAAMSPDFNYLFKGTAARSWYSQLKGGYVNPGEVSLGQNLSNLLRMGLLYRFGGIYLDTDVVVLKGFAGLRNAIGAQTIDPTTRNWSRLNNAVMVFDRGHPLLREFIEEFARTFDGNRWGHNGPYLVSRVVLRVNESCGFNYTVLPPVAFYPVDWSKIGGLFRGPTSLDHSKWIVAKLRQVWSQSFALHLWNKQSRVFEVEKGSIVQHILFSTCVICNFSSLSSVL